MADGYLDTGAAEDAVTSTFTDAATKATAAFSTAQALIAQLGGVTDDLTAESVALPADPGSYSLEAMPDAPTINLPSSSSVRSVSGAPSLDTIDSSTVSIPKFSAASPTVTLPDKPDVTDPEDPGEAPGMDDVSLPGDPDIVLPPPPTLSDVVLPDFASLGTAAFDGERPDLSSLAVPGRLFLYEEGTFSSPLQTAIEQQIYDGLLAGGDITAITGITTALAQVESVAARTLRNELAAVRDGWAARGLDGPTGADNDKEDQARQRYADTVGEATAQLVTEQCRLTMQHRQFLIEHGVSAVQVRLEAFNQAQARALESAKAAAEFGYKMVEMQIAVFNLQLARYQADTALYEAKIRAGNELLEERKLALERARLAGDLRKQDVDVYVAECQAQTVRVEVYKAQVQGAVAKIQAQVEKINAFRATVDAFVAKIGANKSKYEAWATELSGQKLQLECYSEQANAYGKLVSAAATAVQAEATKAGIVSDSNKNKIALYQVELDATKVELQRMIAELDAAVKTAATQIQQYDSTVKGVSALNEARRGLAALDYQAWGTKANVALEEAKLALSTKETKAKLAETAMATQAQVASQLAASAMGSRHASASIGFSGSNSNSNSFNQTFMTTESYSA